jgi:hypothetical protein
MATEAEGSGCKWLIQKKLNCTPLAAAVMKYPQLAILLYLHFLFLKPMLKVQEERRKKIEKRKKKEKKRRRKEKKKS